MPKKKWLREFTLNAAQGRHFQPGYRESFGLLESAPKRVVNFKRGVPVFSKTVDTIQNLATGNRQYKPPVTQARLITDYTTDNYHEMKAKFQFHLDGTFENGGSDLESEIHKVAADLFLVGFIKVRSRFAIGHLQGDTFSMSYMRKWLEDRCNQTGKIDNVHVFNDSYGIPDFRYTKLECIKDWRSPVRKRQHMESIREEARISELEERTRQRGSG